MLHKKYNPQSIAIEQIKFNLFYLQQSINVCSIA